MFGHNSDRFVQLDDRLKQQLLCGICHDIIADAIQLQCDGKHNYCYQCLKQWLSSSAVNKVCPECRQSLITRKRKTRQPVNAVEIVPKVWVERNRTLNNIVGTLRIRCDYHWNGCQVVVPLDSLVAHVGQCPYRLCQTCGHSIGQSVDDQHNCVVALKAAVAEMTNQCKKLSDKNSQLRRQLDAYSKQRINNTTNCQPETKPVIDENGCVVDDNNDDDNHQQTPSTSTPQFIYNYNHPMTLDAVMFGTYRILADIRSMTCKFNVDYIELVNIVSQQQIQWSGSHYWSQNNNGFYLPIHYRQIQKLMYDNTDHQLWQLLVLSVDRVAYDMVKDWMRFNDQSTGRFDTESNDIRERYIILKFRNRLTANKIDSLNQLIQRNKTGNGSQCVCQPITDDIRHHIYNTMM